MTAGEFSLAFIGIAAGLSLAMTLAWAIEQRSGNSGWVDTLWAFGLGAVGITSALIPLGADATASKARRWLVAAAVLAWALRLGVHIASRTAGITDDPRYAALRAGWGAQASWQMWLLVQKQALVSIPLALSIFFAAHNSAPHLRAQDYLGVLIFVVAIAGEAIADRELKQFRKSSTARHAICDAGLWRWSRHPNYFFEWFGWLGYAVIAVDLGGGYPWGWFALAGATCMYWLLVHVSGIPPLEDHMLRTRGDAFRDYRARTSAFFPRPPRQNPRPVPGEVR
jgi:steroid 5-alpha reductase family enzyme